MKAEMEANIRCGSTVLPLTFGWVWPPHAAAEGVEHTPLNLILMLYENKLKEIIRV